MAVAGCLLLLDLDGVVVYEAGPPLVPERGLFSLHDGLAATLRDLGMPVVVLTHRSRREAAVILRSVGLTLGAPGGPEVLGGIVAAEDLFLQAVRGGHFARLARHGLAKSFALAHVERVFGVDRSRVAVIDDRRVNLDDLLAHGVGAALHAPSSVAPDGLGLVTFEFAAAVAVLRRFQAGGPLQDGPSQGGPSRGGPSRGDLSRDGPSPEGSSREERTGVPVGLPPRTRAFASWQPTGFSTRAVERHAFNRLRRAVFHLRRGLRRGVSSRPPLPLLPQPPTARGGGS